MAANNFTGTTNSNWGTATNWSLGAVPTANDGNVATFLVTSPACTVNTSARVCNAIDFTNYTNTITMTYNISVSGNTTLGSGMTIAGTGTLLCIATGNLTSNGKARPNTLTLGTNSAVYTLIDDWVVAHLSSTNSPTANGHQITIQGNLTTGVSATSFGGTTNLIMNGTIANATYSHTSTGVLKTPLEFNAPGNTIIVSGTVYYGGTVGNTLKYTAGTITVTNSTLNIALSCNIDTGGMTWNNVAVTNGTMTVVLLSDLNVAGNFQLNLVAYNAIFNGSYNINIYGNLTAPAMTTSIISGAATFVLKTTTSATRSNVSRTTCYWNLPIVFNASGTINVVGIIAGGNTGFALTYTAGTIVTTGSTLIIGTSNIDLGNTVWNNVQVAQASGAIVTLLSGFSIAGLFSNTDNASHQSIKSSVGGVQRALTLLPTGTCDLTLLDATDIDSSAGQTIYSQRGVFSNSLNWKLRVPPVTVANTF